MKDLLVWKLWDEAHLPEYGTEWAACFDLKASLRDGDEVKVFDGRNKDHKITVADKKVTIFPYERMLVPTGLIFDLDEGYSLRIHPRSGLSLKNGIVLANCEGVVDADYVNQSYVMLHNVSKEPFDISDGMRISQGEVVEVNQSRFVLSDSEPEKKSSRSGGFGSTGA